MKLKVECTSLLCYVCKEQQADAGYAGWYSLAGGKYMDSFLVSIIVKYTDIQIYRYTGIQKRLLVAIGG